MKRFGRFIKELGHGNNIRYGVLIGVVLGATTTALTGLYAWIYSAWDESKVK